MNKYIYILLLLLLIPSLAFGQSSAVMVNANGTITVPASGNLTSNGTITAATLTGDALTIRGATGGVYNTNTGGNLQLYGDGFCQVATGGYLGSGFNLPGGNGTVAEIYHLRGSLQIYATGGVLIGNGSGAGTYIQNIYSASASINFASTSAQTTNSGNTITVTGVTTTNTPSVEIGLSGALPTGCSVRGIVTSNNTVTLYLDNASASPQDPGALTIRATVTGF